MRPIWSQLATKLSTMHWVVYPVKLEVYNEGEIALIAEAQAEWV